jgi:tetratricopeptide (TPR) repeat protein
MFTEQHHEAEKVLTDSLALARRSRDPVGEAKALNQLGSVASNTGRLEQARKLHEQALAIARRAGDRPLTARALHLLGEDLRDLGDLDRATAMLEEAAAIDTELGDRDAAMTSLHSLGDLALDGRDTARAQSRYREALAICHELGDERSQAYCLAGLASIAALLNDAELAGRLWEVAEGVEQRLDLRMLAEERKRYERILANHAHDASFQAGQRSAHQQSLEAVVQELLTR